MAFALGPVSAVILNKLKKITNVIKKKKKKVQCFFFFFIHAYRKVFSKRTGLGLGENYQLFCDSYRYRRRFVRNRFLSDDFEYSLRLRFFIHRKYGLNNNALQLKLGRNEFQVRFYLFKQWLSSTLFYKSNKNVEQLHRNSWRAADDPISRMGAWRSSHKTFASNITSRS